MPELRRRRRREAEKETGEFDLDLDVARTRDAWRLFGSGGERKVAGTEGNEGRRGGLEKKGA